MQKYLSSRVIELLGQFCGLAIATGGDYILVPWLVEKTGQMAIGLIVGLVFGAIIMVACGEAPRRVANAMRRNQGLVGVRRGVGSNAQMRRLSLSTLAYALLVVLTMIAMVLGQLLPSDSFR